MKQHQCRQHQCRQSGHLMFIGVELFSFRCHSMIETQLNSCFNAGKCLFIKVLRLVLLVIISIAPRRKLFICKPERNPGLVYPIAFRWFQKSANFMNFLHSVSTLLNAQKSLTAIMIQNLVHSKKVN